MPWQVSGWELATGEATSSWNSARTKRQRPEYQPTPLNSNSSSKNHTHVLTLRATREPVSDSPLLQVRLSGVPHLLSYLYLSLGAVRPRSQGAPLVGGGPHSTDCLWQGQQTKQQVSGRPPPYHHTNMVFDGGCHVTLLHSSPYVYTVTMPLYPIVNVLVTQTLSC